jgi:hypothetical protein
MCIPEIPFHRRVSNECVQLIGQRTARKCDREFSLLSYGFILGFDDELRERVDQLCR